MVDEEDGAVVKREGHWVYLRSSGLRHVYRVGSVYGVCDAGEDGLECVVFVHGGVRLLVQAPLETVSVALGCWS